MHAAWSGHLAVVEYLVERGADIDVENIVSDETTNAAHMNKYICEWISMGAPR